VKISATHTSRGPRLTISRDIDAAPQAVWELIASTDRWHEWGPPVTGVDPAAARIEAGMEGRVQTYGDTWVPFTIDTCTDRYWTWSVKGWTPPADGHRVKSLSDGRTRMILELPLWAPWYLPLCVWALHNIASVLE
jgi:uncharacterized protein YndB with AHSA1/START domain